jgi:hypothetical protein
VRRLAQGKTQFLWTPGVGAILLICRDDIGRIAVRDEEIDDPVRLAERLRARTIYQDNQTEHPLGEDLPHKVEALLPGCAEKMQHQIGPDRDATEVHRNRSLLFDHPGIIGRAALGRDHLDLAD